METENIDFHALLGKHYPDLQILMTTWGQHETKHIAKETFYNFKSAGISLCFMKEDESLKLDCIWVYNGGIDGFAQFKGRVPFELSLDMTNADVVEKLGEPQGKPLRGNVIAMFVDYKKLGLQIDFVGKSYDDNKNPISSICFYPPQLL